MSGTILKARVIAVDPVHVHICCPICGRLHKHGSGGNINEQNYGHRLAHCGAFGLPWIDGSFWDNPRHDSYELVCTEDTVRKETNASGYVNRWYKENRLKAYNLERRQIARDIKHISQTEAIPLVKAYEKIMLEKQPEIQIS